jgi:hypothetical protein
MGNVNLLAADSTNLEGTDASINIYELLEGVGSVDGSFSLQLNGEIGELLSTESSASEMRDILMKLPLVGDITVTKRSMPSLIPPAIISQAWMVTFTTLGDPVNAGFVGSLSPYLLVPLDDSFYVQVNPDPNILNLFFYFNLSIG